MTPQHRRHIIDGILWGPLLPILAAVNAWLWFVHPILQGFKVLP